MAFLSCITFKNIYVKNIISLVLWKLNQLIVLKITTCMISWPWNDKIMSCKNCIITNKHKVEHINTVKFMIFWSNFFDIYWLDIRSHLSWHLQPFFITWWWNFLITWRCFWFCWTFYRRNARWLLNLFHFYNIRLIGSRSLSLLSPLWKF